MKLWQKSGLVNIAYGDMLVLAPDPKPILASLGPGSQANPSVERDIRAG